MKLSISWNKVAIRQLEKIVDYVRNDSEVNADKVEKVILTKIASIVNHPEIHLPDKYKRNNGGSFRAFEVYHCRISYRIKKNEIRIIPIRHTKMNPLRY